MSKNVNGKRVQDNGAPQKKSPLAGLLALLMFGLVFWGLSSILSSEPATLTVTEQAQIAAACERSMQELADIVYAGTGTAAPDVKVANAAEYQRCIDQDSELALSKK